MDIDFDGMDSTQLQALIQDAQRVLDARDGLQQPLRITQDFGSYNDKRYARPWIARIEAWPIGGRPELAFGSYVGDYRGGETEIAAQPGDLIRWGQKDNRGNNSTSYWGVVESDGSVRSIDQSEARQLYHVPAVQS